MSTRENMHILLVHGSGHDQSCWDFLIPILEQKYGFCVHTLTLSGHGSEFRNHFRVGMSTYVEDVCARARDIDEPPVLLGHSMGGAVISMAAERSPGLFRQLIYLTAVAPSRNGKSMAFQNTEAFATEHAKKTIRLQLLRGSAYYSPNGAVEMFYNRCSTEMKSRAARLLCRQPLRPLFSPLKWTRDRLGSMPASYIECTDDNAINISLQRTFQDNLGMTKVITLDSDHSPFYSMPEKLADGISQLVDE